MIKSHVAPISFTMMFSTYLTLKMCGDNIDDKEEEKA